MLQFSYEKIKNNPTSLHCLRALHNWTAFVVLVGVFIMQIIKVDSKKYGSKDIFVDDEDYVYLMQWKWHIIRDNEADTFYALRDVRIPQHTQVRMHRQILGLADKEIEVDHRDHNGLNNQKLNLRACIGDDNRRNRRKREGYNSNYIGVTTKISKKGGTSYWMALITHKKMRKSKCFPYTPEGEILAAKERDKMSIQCFGAFANLNFNESL